MFGLPPVTQSIIIANVLVFLLELTFGNSLISSFALWPLGSQFQPWQLLTYAFLHGGVTHILLAQRGIVWVIFACFGSSGRK